MILLSIFLSVNVLTVFCASSEDNQSLPNHEPKVAFWCGKVNQHIDLKTGNWKTDENGESMCARNEEQILRYCKYVYSSLDVRNIVETNTPELITKWCAPYNVNCTANKEVKTYRCLVGAFEADALLVPKGCRFEHLHKGSKCKSHDVWKGKAVDKCREQGMALKNYGVLIPCDTGKFTGVEFVCCPQNMTIEVPTDSSRVVPVLIGGKEDVGQPFSTSTPKPTTFLEKLEHELKKFSKHLTGKSIGCDSKKYHVQRKNMESTHRQRMSRVIKQWEASEKRYNILKNDDPTQAEQMIKGVMERFKQTIATLESQAKLERHQLHEEHHQCVQIDLNDKKNKALRSFLRALKKDPADGNAVLKAIRKFLDVCTKDRLHNRRHFEYMSKIKPEKIDEIRETFQNHLSTINQRVNETMVLLYKLPKIARKFYFELPTWAPKPKVLPTETPTATEIKTVTVDKSTDAPKVEKEHLEGGISRDEHDHTINSAHRIHGKSEQKHPHAKDNHQKKKKPKDKENEPEDEEYFEKAQTPATFAVVIGLSCGALVMMIIIIIVMAMRKSRSSNPTKTVLVDPNNDGNSEQQHLANLQQNGYENPTYKFNEY